MSTRRPRVKAAAILKPRRPQSTPNDDDAGKIVNSDDIPEEQSTSIEVNGNGQSVIARNQITSIATNAETKLDIKPILIAESMAIKTAIVAHKINQSHINSDTISENKRFDVTHVSSSSSKSVPKSLNLSTNAGGKGTPTPFRRIPAPPVNIVNRRKSSLAADNRPGHASSPTYIKSPSYSFVRDNVQTSKDVKPNVNESPMHPGSRHPDDEIFSPAPTENDECFKSPPFMSPIYSRRIEPSMSPFHDIYGDEYTKSPSSVMSNTATKVRQRIRPTPCFASRRNSIQGNSLGGASESEDEQHRRQRHYSTSSNHSNYNPSTTPQHHHHHQRNYFGLNKMPARIRTESYSSSISDIPFSKSKRSHRSEEYQRVANAKREFNQRLNGKPPDKSRLTMYDLIYYNPLTNPMSKPAAKGDKHSDTASISSVKTNQSRSSGSVKSETSTEPVKTEKSETTDTVTGPVPQLKLDANGEIILDEKSLVIETTGDKEAREMLANSDVVYDDEFSGTSGFYKRQKRTRDWLPLETLKFYRSLQTIGTDFSVMLQLFPNRSRRDLKLKFKKEEKHNMALINKALLHPKEFNVDELKLQFDKEDEEIEQKKQEWAEVRKKMATERREQLNASKKRNPHKQVSRSMRSLTDGDIIYENEFLALPPKSRRSNRKRIVQTNDLDEQVKIQPIDSMLSPIPINHNNNNNNHVESLPYSLPQHTYATHKLPSFTEMIESQKSRHALRDTIKSDENVVPKLNIVNIPANNVDRLTNPDIESNGMHTNGGGDDESSSSSASLHAIDLSTTTTTTSTTASGSLIIHGKKSNEFSCTSPKQLDNGNEQFGNDSTIDQYIAKNPNLTFKGSGDIMNMDIIFENVSIEEDITIGHEVTTETAALSPPTQALSLITTTTTSTSTSTEPIDESPIVTTISESQLNNVNIAGVQYEIITLENSDVKQTTACDAKVITNSTETLEDVATNTITMINDDGNYMYSSNDMVIMSCSSLNVATEIDAIDESNVEHTIILPVPSDSYQVINLPDDENTEQIERKSSIKEDKTVEESITVHSTPQNTANERKRKRKAIPLLLANNKRTRRPNMNATIDIKQTDIEHRSPNEITTCNNEYEQEQEQIKSTATELATTSSAQTKQIDEQIQANDDDETDNQTMDETTVDTDTQERSFIDSLVVVESQDSNDPNRTIHEVYVIDPETNEMSEKPLDLPDHVIQRIRSSMS